MTRDELVALVQNNLFEGSATTGLADSTQYNTVVNNANKKVWRQAVKEAPSLFEVRSPDVSYNSGPFDIASLADDGVYLLNRVYVKASQFVSTNDAYIALEPIEGNERYVFGRNVVASPALPSGYYLEGENLYLAPMPSSSQTLQIVHIPNVADFAAGTDIALGGVSALSPFHELVALEATLTLCAKDEASSSFQVWMKLRDEMAKDMVRHLSRRQTQRSRFIREVPFA